MSNPFDCQALFTREKIRLTKGVVSSCQMDLASYVKKRRDELGLSLRELAKRSGLSHAYIGYLEAGENPQTGRPISHTIEALEKLAKGLNVPFETLARLARGIPLDAPRLTNEQAQEVIDRAKTWDAAKARQILRLIDALEGDEKRT